MSNATPNSLADEIGKRDEFDSLKQEAYLNLVRSYSLLSTQFSQLYKKHGLTDPKYNALRILRGEGKPMQVYQIAERMVTPQTDVTRLVDRLEDAKFVSRERCSDDRRVVWVKLTKRGKEVLRKLDKPVSELHESQFAGFSKTDLRQLNQFLFRIRHQ